MKNLFNKKADAEKEANMINYMETALADIYGNKSSDEYKMHGDITKSSEYKTIERMISDLRILKGFSKSESDDLKMLFLTLHRPIFPKMVTEYVAKPNERNTTFTTVYTVGYRLLIGELSRVYASTEATDKGIIYQPDKITRKDSSKKLIKHFNESLDKKIDIYIRETTNKNKSSIKQEGAVEAIGYGLELVTGFGGAVALAISKVFKAATELNPISLVNALLSRSYNKKVENFEYVAAMYEATKQAYDDYMKIPEAQRKQKVESKYLKNIDKYNIRMQNLKAKIDHYDSRATEEAKDNETKTPKKTEAPKNDSGFDF
jgi:hypothetical protein